MGFIPFQEPKGVVLQQAWSRLLSRKKKAWPGGLLRRSSLCGPVSACEGQAVAAGLFLALEAPPGGGGGGDKFDAGAAAAAATTTAAETYALTAACTKARAPHT